MPPEGQVSRPHIVRCWRKSHLKTFFDKTDAIADTLPELAELVIRTVLQKP